MNFYISRVLDVDQLPQVLPGVHVRDVRQDDRVPAERGHPVRPQVALRGSKALRVLVRHQLQVRKTVKKAGLCFRYSYIFSVSPLRESNKAFAVNGITFNHESPRRPANYVTRKITQSVARIHLGLQDFVELGNLDSRRDWGHARDYVDCIWRILQLDQPGDFVIATGQLRTVRSLVEAAFRCVGRQIAWEGSGTDEVGREGGASGTVRVRVNPAFYRPTESTSVCGCSDKVVGL